MHVKLGWDPGKDSGHKGMSASGVLAFYSTRGTWAVTIPLSSGLEMPEHGGGAPENGRTREVGAAAEWGVDLNRRQTGVLCPMAALTQDYHQGGPRKQAEVSCQEARMVPERNRGNPATALLKSIFLWSRRETVIDQGW